MTGEVADGGSGSDTIDVTAGAHIIDGGAGDDSLDGGEGDDKISGGDGAGAPVLIATLSPGTNLAASDIQLIDEGSFNSQVGEAVGWLNAVLFSL